MNLMRDRHWRRIVGWTAGAMACGLAAAVLAASGRYACDVRL